MDNSNNTNQPNTKIQNTNKVDQSRSSSSIANEPYQNVSPSDTNFILANLQQGMQDSQQKTSVTPPPPWKNDYSTKEDRLNAQSISNFTPAPPETGHIISASQMTIKPPKKYIKTSFLIALIVGILISTAVGGYYLYNFLFSPLRVFEKSIANIESAQSYTANITLNTEDTPMDIILKVDVQKSDYQYSRAQLDIKNITNETGHNFTLLLIFNSLDTFLTANYSNIDLIDQAINASMPDLVQTQSYNLLKELLSGEKWLHITNEEIQTPSEGGIQITKEQEEGLNEKFARSILIKQFDRNYQQDGITYYRITAGFDKKILIEFVESLKSLDLEVELKDINSLIKVIEATDGWDSELIEILIDKNTEYLTSVSLSLPDIPEDALKQGLEEVADDESTVDQYFEMFNSTVSEIIEKDDENKINYIGKVSFSNYNSAPAGERPEELIEYQELIDVFKNEAPIFTQLFLGGLIEQSTPQSAPPPVYGDSSESL